MTVTATDQALIALARLIKQIDFYPPGHPSLEVLVHQAVALLAQATAADALTVNVRREGLVVQNRPAAGGPAVQGLARALSARRIRSLRFAPGRTVEDLIGLARALALPAEQLYLQGGLARMLAAYQVNGILADESSVREATREPSADAAAVAAPATPPPPQDTTRDLKTLLSQLRSVPPAQWPPLLTELERAASPMLTAAPVAVALKLFPLLIRLVHRPGLTDAEQLPLRQTLNRLCHDGLLAQLLDQIGLANRSEDQRRALTLILADQFARTLTPLLALYPGARPPQRAEIEQILAARRPLALTPLRQQLDDEDAERRLVAIRLLGVLGDRLSIDRLSSLIRDPHPDCARAALVALAQMGTAAAGEHLLVALSDDRRDIRLAAIAALGQMAYDAAVEPLVAITAQADIWAHRLPERQEALEALGHIGGERATLVLLRTLRQWFLRQRVADALQTAAVAGLLNHQHPAIEPALEKALKHRSIQVRRMARQILNRRQDPHGTATP